MELLGDNIRKARKKLGITQEELAGQIGVTSQAVSRWESGAGMPDISMLVPLAKVLDVSIDQLFGVEKTNQDETIYYDITRAYEKIELEASDMVEAVIEKYKMLAEKCEIEPANYVYACCLVERVSELSRFRHDDRAKAIWKESRYKAVRLAMQVIRFCNEKEWVERTHYALAFIYMAEEDYESAREHVMMLPSIDSNRMRESILAQLVASESGIEEMNKTVLFNLQKFARAINKEFLYAAEIMTWKADPKETIEFATWGIEVMKALEKKPEIIPYNRGFFRDLYRCIIFSDLALEDYENAAKHWQELKLGMEGHFSYYQKVLENDELKAVFTDRQLGRMRGYTREVIEDKQKDILARIQQIFGDEKYKKFLGMI